MPRRAPVTETRLPAEGRREHALDPRDCTCDEGACIAAAIERVSAVSQSRYVPGDRPTISPPQVVDLPGPARCDDSPEPTARRAG